MIGKTIIGIVLVLGASSILTWLNLPPHRVVWALVRETIAQSFGLIGVVFLAVLAIIFAFSWAAYRLYAARRFWGVAALVIAAFGILVIWFPRFQVAVLDRIPEGTSEPQLENEFRRTWAGILGGMVVLGGLAVAWRRAEASVRQAAAIEQGNITERYTRAIDQLGKLNRGDTTPHVVIRIGGIYALEGIVEDTKKMEGNLGERYHNLVIDVLAAYVRESSPYDPNKKQILKEKLGEDIQAALTVIGRLGNPGERIIDLSRTFLKKAKLESAKISFVSFEGAFLDGASFIDASFPFAWFDKASLRGAFMPDADFSHGEFSGANLDEAILDGANMQDSNLQCTMRKTRFMFTDLRNAFFVADVSETMFDRSDLRGSDLRKAEGLKHEQIGMNKIDRTTRLPGPFRPIPMETWDEMYRIMEEATPRIVKDIMQRHEDDMDGEEKREEK